MKLRKTVLAAVLGAGLAIASLPASAGHVPGVSFQGSLFTVNPSVIPGETQGPFNAGAMNFSYTAEVDQLPGTGDPGPGATSEFTETGIAQITAFLNERGGTAIPSLTTGLNLSGPGIPSPGYQLFVEFQATGDATVNNAGGVDGVFETFALQFWVDPNNNTTMSCPTAGAPNEGPCTRGGVLGDDILALTGNLTVGGFHVFPGLVEGDFNVQFEVTLNPIGFFTQETVPVGTLGDIAGSNSCIDHVPGDDECTAPPPPPFPFVDAIITGSGDSIFQRVPEPGTLALIGLALLGAGFSSRRSKVA